MSRIEWNKAGERFFETGVDRGVLFPKLGPGVPWNGLVSVSESGSGGDLEPLYFDGVKYADFGSSEDFGASVEAYAAPPEFASSMGIKQLAPGFSVTQQPRTQFGLCYRTLIGNDLVATEYGYKLHVVYNCTAAPSGRSNKTIADQTNPDTQSWTVSTVPPPATTFKPTAHVVIDSTKVNAARLSNLEDALYGKPAQDPYLPTIAQMLAILTP